LKDNIDELFIYIVGDSTKIWGEKNLGVTPKVMKEATMGYFRENDTMEMFIDECCEVGEGFKVGAKDIYDRYVE
jgi:phage/plasmid-associated DNA primase